MLTDTRITDFENHLRLSGRSDKTIANYMSDIKLMYQTTGIKSAAEITEDKILLWNQDGLSKYHTNTRQRHRVAVRQYLTFLANKEIIPPLSNLLPSLRTAESDPCLLSKELFLKILHAQDHTNPISFRDGALITFLACTGIRREELQMVRMGDITIAADGKLFSAVIQSVKPKDRRRIVNFGNIAQSGDIATCHFGFWYARRLAEFGGRTSSKARSMPLFSSLETPGIPLSLFSIHQSVQRACKRLKDFDWRKVTPHTLRHFFATEAKHNGMDIKVIQHYLGHESVASTEKYIHYAEKLYGLEALEHGPTKGLRAKPELITTSASSQADYMRAMIATT